MRKVAAELGLSATAIYRHYRDKEELLDAVAEEGFAVFRSYLDRALAASMPRQRIRGLALRYLDFALDHPHHYDFCFLIPRKNVRRFPREFVQRDDLTFHILSKQVELAMREGSIVVGDPVEIGLTIWAHVHGLIALYRAGRFGADEERFRNLYLRSVERLFAGIET